MTAIVFWGKFPYCQATKNEKHSWRPWPALEGMDEGEGEGEGEHQICNAFGISETFFFIDT